jgi:hypothetical protein
MSYFFSLRGWLEMDHPEAFASATKKLRFLKNLHVKNPIFSVYMQGWTWNETPFNWSAYIHYGGDVKIEGIELFERTINELTSLDLKLDGFFHAQGEDMEKNYSYKIMNDKVLKEETSFLINTSLEKE